MRKKRACVVSRSRVSCIYTGDVASPATYQLPPAGPPEIPFIYILQACPPPSAVTVRSMPPPSTVQPRSTDQPILHLSHLTCKKSVILESPSSYSSCPFLNPNGSNIPGLGGGRGGLTGGIACANNLCPAPTPIPGLGIPGFESSDGGL